ncbi:hypothetical protein WR25_26421 [Diploscapter pachys]|uniref:DDB1- and CUL4-associated factor 11 homolog n=1 Tax=Diploscapter pachys TaxID=2018661 RepID=A0A2A2JLW6_9BILA|nr:hypothetical protein WR25_26421 [Diploscapter pachys]
MYKRERDAAFRGRFTVGDPDGYEFLKQDILSHCSQTPTCSVPDFLGKREIGHWKRRARSTPKAEQAAYVNKFFPNCRKIVNKTVSKTFCCQYVRDGDQLVCASQDEMIRFFRKNQGRSDRCDRYVMDREIMVKVCSWSILDVAIARDASALAYGTWKDAVFYGRLTDQAYDESNNFEWSQLDIPDIEHNMAVFSVRFSHDSSEILCGSSDYRIHIFDIATEKRVVSIEQAHGDDVNSVCYGDNDHLIYSGGDDGIVKVWDRRAWREGDTLQPVGEFGGHRDGVTFVDARGDDRYLLSNSKDQTIKVWDLRKFSSKNTIKDTVDCVKGQKWDYRWMPAPPGMCKPIEGDTSVVTLRGHSVLHTLIRAKWSPERTGRRYVYTGCARGEVVVYDFLKDEVCQRLKGHMAVVRDCDWHPEENEIATSSWDGNTAVWRFDERKCYGGNDDEMSCDESYKPIVPKKKFKPRRKMCYRTLPTRTMNWDSDSEMD